jgi:hypothetical protein
MSRAARCNGGLFAGSRPIIKRFQRTIRNRPLDAALDRLMVHTEGSADSKEGRVLAIGQKHSRPLNVVCRLGSRRRYLPQAPQILFSNRQFQLLTPRRHDCSPRSVNQSQGDKMGIRAKNSNMLSDSIGRLALPAEYCLKGYPRQACTILVGEDRESDRTITLTHLYLIPSNSLF